jgi:hypothetical protein
VSQRTGLWVSLTRVTSLFIVENFAVALVAHAFYLDTFVNGVIQGASETQVPPLYALPRVRIISAKPLMIFWAHDGKNRKVVTETYGVLILETIVDPKLLSILYTF